MYLFDLDDFKCDQIPNDWEDYGVAYRNLFNQNLKCVNTLIDSKSGEFPKEVMDKLYELFEEYKDAIDEARANLNILINTLYEEYPSGSNCFDKTLYTNYITSFNIVKNLLKEINLWITTGGDVIGYDLNVGVDTKIIYPTSGSTSTKVVKCTGVYMKQMDFGSEFIGSVTVMGGEPEPAVGIDWVGLAAPRDGEWFYSRS